MESLNGPDSPSEGMSNAPAKAELITATREAFPVEERPPAHGMLTSTRKSAPESRPNPGSPAKRYRARFSRRAPPCEWFFGHANDVPPNDHPQRTAHRRGYGEWLGSEKTGRWRCLASAR